MQRSHQINAAKSKSKTELKQKRTQRKGDKKAKNAKKLAEQCVMGFHEGWNKWKEAKKNVNEVKGQKKSEARKALKSNQQHLQMGNARSCRWDLKPYFNNQPAPQQPFAHVCQGIISAMAVEAMYAIRNKPAHPYDISVQAILDCYTPETCFYEEGQEMRGCAPRYVLDKMLNAFHDPATVGDKAMGIFLNAKDYRRQFNPAIRRQEHCLKMVNKEKWARGYFTYKMWLSKERLLRNAKIADEEDKKHDDEDKKQDDKKEKSKKELRMEKQKKVQDGAKVMNSALNKDFEVYDKTKTPSIPVMMDLLKKGPFIANLKASIRLGAYKLDNENEINDLSKALDLDAHPNEQMRKMTHSFLVIGYVKPQKSSEIYFLVKTCKTGEHAWGWQGKGFMKMKTATGGPYGFNSEIYQVMPSDTKPKKNPPK